MSIESEMTELLAQVKAAAAEFGAATCSVSVDYADYRQPMWWTSWQTQGQNICGKHAGTFSASLAATVAEARERIAKRDAQTAALEAADKIAAGLARLVKQIKAALDKKGQP